MPNIITYKPDCQVPLTRQRANPAWAEGVQLALGAKMGFTRHKSYLRSCFILIDPQWDPRKTPSPQGNERRYRIFNAIKWLYDAPGVIRLVQQHLGWPTPNHLMTHYYRRYPHTSWWARAHQQALKNAKIYNIKYLLEALAAIAERALEWVAELFTEAPQPGEDPALSYEDRLRLRLSRLLGYQDVEAAPGSG